MSVVHPPTVDAARLALSRRAASELQGSLRSAYDGQVGPPLHSKRLPVKLGDPFRAFLTGAHSGLVGDDLVAHALAASGSCELSEGDLEREVRRWVRGMDEALGSATRIALGPSRARNSSRWDRFGQEVAHLYTYLEDDTHALLLVPGHVLAWARDRRAKYQDLGKQSAHDTDVVLEVVLGLYAPGGGGELQRPRNALRAARALVNGA